MATVTAPAASLSIAPTTTLADLRAIVDQLGTEHPNAGGRLDHAAFIATFREVERGANAGTWWVQSETDPNQTYLVTEGQRCVCQDFARRGALTPCKHLLCVAILKRAERLEAERGTPAETLIDVDGEPIPYSITAEALAVLDEARQRDAARCPECNTWKQHGSLYCGGERCEAPPRWVPAIIA